MTGYTQGKHLPHRYTAGVHSRYVYTMVHGRYVWEVSPHCHEFATKRPLVDVESRGGWADLRKDSTWGENLTLL